ncbi:MAG: UDP-2,3-diacylglucosamine diphosphatase LpxI [Candidatus Omnitrophica bacterium]|nr:UDP-2,3-diacylglucosamine diphosphatase LpxI [Candidatus Omnitrophota bacterium]
MKCLGLIAGNGRFPIAAAVSAKKRGIKITAVAFIGETSKSLEKLVEKIFWIRIGELAKLFEIFERENIKEAIMAGQIRPIHLFKPWIKKDAALKSFLRRVRDRRGDSLLESIAEELSKKGIKLLDSSFLLSESLAEEGELTARVPTADEWENIKFGKIIVKEIAGLGIGQTIIVKNKAILAVEAIEGTDKAIRRAVRLGGSGAIVVKASRPNHDMRFDIPVIGLKTLKVLKKAKIKVLAVEAGKTLLIDKQKFLKEADRLNISIIAF